MIILYILDFLCCLVITFIIAAWILYITGVIKTHIIAKRIILKLCFKSSVWVGIRYFFPIIFASSGDIMRIIDSVLKQDKQEDKNE